MGSKIINPNKNLQAYIIGLALGDGNLSNPNGRAVRLRISCDAKYPKLIQKIQKSLQSLFPENITSIFPRKCNCVDISCYSNKWPQVLGWHPLGSKYLQGVDIPEWIKKDRKFSIHCIRGLIETDGSIYDDRGYTMILFTSIIPNLARSFASMVKQLGFVPRLYTITPKTRFFSKKLYHVRISKNTKKFLELIKPEKI